jgi:hypothetical protein
VEADKNDDKLRKEVEIRMSQDSSVGIETDYGLNDRMNGVRLPAGAGNLSLPHRVQTGSGAHSASYPMGTRVLYLGVKRSGRKADHSPPSTAEVKNASSYTSTPHTSSWRGAYLRTGKTSTLTFLS